jgi:hypothetical protein
MMNRNGIHIFSLIIKPLLVMLVIVCVFGLVYLRSSYLRLEYNLGDLEKKKMNCLKERKTLLAEKTSRVSFARLESSQNDADGFVLPDRIKVVHVNKQKRHLPYRASLESRQLAE